MKNLFNWFKFDPPRAKLCYENNITTVIQKQMRFRSNDILTDNQSFIIFTKFK
jgi:hypothetical protein